MWYRRSPLEHSPRWFVACGLTLFAVWLGAGCGGSSRADVDADATTGSDVTQSADGVQSADVTRDILDLPNCDRVTPVEGEVTLAAELVVDKLGSLVDIAFVRGDRERIYLAERQQGTIWVVKDGVANEMGSLKSVINASGGEQGFLSLAFHPDFVNNRKIYVYYTVSNADTKLAELTATDADHVDVSTLKVLLTIDEGGESNHNGGALRFGPDGLLYLSTGDGGGGGDAHGPIGNAQRKDVLLGKMLRFDVDGQADGKLYAIPPNNAFSVDSDFLPEILHWGLRNPWRYSFDRVTGDLIIGDVGQNTYEELDWVPAGSVALNFGWRCREGLHSYKDDTHCGAETFTEPILELPQDDGFHAVVGGYRYRGCRMPAYQGQIFYSDAYIGSVRAFRFENGAVVPGSDRSVLSVPGGSLVSFGEDHQGELYFVTLGGGLYRIVPQ
ncbi:MAG: PQQ-dependent sugar dehydrogenase [Myxococcales bacterium]|nr:PQQ-dependent sugar dehydrogenase [Myxococcales bacterium]